MSAIKTDGSAPQLSRTDDKKASIWVDELYETVTMATVDGFIVHLQIQKRALERIRTSDLWYRKPALYPLSYEGRGADTRVSGCALVAGLAELGENLRNDGCRVSRLSEQR